MKKRGFTLIELLIVTVVIVTLMGLVFRLAGSGSESWARSETISRLQKLSNALSGYYAAFGSYPPVPLQGRSRDINTRVDNSGSMGYGIQHAANEQNSISDWSGKDAARQIEAACRAQPVAAICPYRPGGGEDIAIQTLCQVLQLPKIYKAIDHYGPFSNKDSPNWSENQVFMFGLMSFLLPRYQFMLDGEDNIYTDHPDGPWESNNRLPILMNGERKNDWGELRGELGVKSTQNETSDSTSSRKYKVMLENLPSQAVCARWMPNFAGIVITTPVASHTTFFGVDTNDPHDYNNSASKWCIISPNGAGSEAIYAQMKKTVADGWGEEFYYYSPPPYQSYQLWSSGPNKRTYPPWMEKYSGQEKLINKWIADDIKVGDK